MISQSLYPRLGSVHIHLIKQDKIIQNFPFHLTFSVHFRGYMAQRNYSVEYFRTVTFCPMSKNENITCLYIYGMCSHKCAVQWNIFHKIIKRLKSSLSFATKIRRHAVSYSCRDEYRENFIFVKLLLSFSFYSLVLLLLGLWCTMVLLSHMLGDGNEGMSFERWIELKLFQMIP